MCTTKHTTPTARCCWKLEDGGMRADVCSVFSADFCCPGVDSEAAGWVWPGISIVSLTLQGVSKSPAHFARHEWRIVYFLNTLVAALHTALSLSGRHWVTNLRSSFSWESGTELSLVSCFEEFNLKFNQAAEHDRKNCLNSQHHQILWWYHIFAFLKMNFNPSGKIWENWALPMSRRSCDCICTWIWTLVVAWKLDFVWLPFFKF